jgi:diadenosine tetraphosphate (Ap4A) HIT family hydrolase
VTACPFCDVDADRVFDDSDDLACCLWDGFAVSPGHVLVVTRRHVGSWFDASEEEQHALLRAIARVKRHIEAERSPDGYSIGLNVGAAAGQTIDHLHLHVIPRYDGDVYNPRGGVRNVIPSRGDYTGVSELIRPWPASSHARVVGNATQPMLTALRE